MYKIALLLFAALFIGEVLYSQCEACQSLNDRIINGSFENGTTGFNSSLDYVTFFPFVCTLCPENSFAIGNNATLFHSGFSGTDHTNPPSGDFFIANAPGEAGVAVWCQSIGVLPQTLYTFTFWARDVANNNNPHPLAVLRPSFNGSLATDSLIAQGGWSSLSTTWFSDATSILDVCIFDFQSQTGGNDFGLDDISLTACEPIQLSQAPFAGNDTVICSQDLLGLGALPINNYSYLWNEEDELSSNQIGNPFFQASNTSGVPAEYSLIVTRDSANVGCIASDSITITVLSMFPLDLGNDQMICPTDSVLLDCGDVWDTILWSNTTTTPLLWASPGSYTVSTTIGQCTENDTISVLPYTLTPTNLPETIEHCTTSPLIVSAAVDGTWNGINGPSENPITIENSGAYYFSFSDQNCYATDTVNIELYTLWEAQLPSDTTLCEGTSATILSDYPGAWSTGLVGTQLDTNLPGIFTIEVTNGACVSYDTLTIVSLPQPMALLGADTTFCEDYPLLLSTFNANATYAWSTGDTTATITTIGSGLYEVEVRNSCGVASDEILITNYPCSWQLYVPSCFTPNEDTFNETWNVSGCNIKQIDTTIYNRFGDAVFHSTDMNASWQPSDRVGDDIYNYRIEVTPFEGSKEVRTGAIYLVR